MRIQPECVPCLMKRVLFQSGLVEGADELSSLKAAADVFSESLCDDVVSAKIATEVHRRAYAAIGCTDPYMEMKLEADRVAEPLVDPLGRVVGESDDPFRAAVMAAVIGNIMDFGSGIAIDDPEEFKGMYRQLLDQGLGYDDLDRAREVLDSVSGVVYIFDNCGESQLDKILIRYLRGIGKRVVAVVRGAPILNDVTMEDALRIGMDREVDRLLTTGKFQIGLDWNDMPPELVEEIDNCGMIIAKGMANYESTSDEEIHVPVVHILRSKCRPVAESMGVPKDVNVLKLIMPEDRMVN